MPCNTVRTVTQVLENIEDVSILISALRAMGMVTEKRGNSIFFYGSFEGVYISGSYARGRITTQDGIDLTALKRYMGVANLNKNAAAHRWIVKPVEGKPFEVDINKKKDTMRAEVLPDGVIKLTCPGKISAPNHLNAEKMVGAIERDAGGEVNIHRLKHHHEHHHHTHHLHH